MVIISCGRVDAPRSSAKFINEHSQHVCINEEKVVQCAGALSQAMKEKGYDCRDTSSFPRHPLVPWISRHDTNDQLRQSIVNWYGILFIKIVHSIIEIGCL